MFRSLYIRLALLVICAVLLAACGAPQATPTPTRTPRPAQTATPLRPTIAPPPTIRPVETLAPPPTAAPIPTATAVPPTATATANAYERATDINPLTGLKVVSPVVLARRPLFVVINNDLPARAVHYGFAEADLVYEYIMEGRGVSRFTVVYLAGESQRIGPVRSARLVNWYLTPQYGGALVASGAGNDVRWWLKNKMAAPYLDIDLDDPGNNIYSFTVGTNYMTRMQTSTIQLRKWLADWKVEQDPKLRGFAFADAAPAGSSGKSASIAFPAAVSWTYDATGGRYLRSMSGAAHNDAATGKQLNAANVIIQTVPHQPTTYVEDSLGTTSIRIITVGEGPVIVLRDGVAIKGTWKAGDASMPEFFDAAGKLIPLKPGNTWFELVAPTDAVTVG